MGVASHQSILRKNVLRGLTIVAVCLVVAVASGAVFVARTWNRIYDVPLPDVQPSQDPEVLRRGDYLVYGPAHCVACHAGSYAEFQKLADGEQVPLRGGIAFAAPPLGVIFSKNLTPDPDTGIGRYSDGQIARMMRWSVRADGRASVRPLMPFHNMSDDDLVAIISSLRRRAPVRHRVPADNWTAIGKVVKSLSSTFKPRTNINPPAQAPAERPTRERGDYLAHYVSNCAGCHTRLDNLTFEPTGPEFAGGEIMEPIPMPDADLNVWFTSPNITPAKGSALDKFPDRATFVARFKVGGRKYAGSPMPWEAFQRMSEADLGGLYEYLHGLAPREGPTGDPTFRKRR